MKSEKSEKKFKLVTWAEDPDDCDDSNKFDTLEEAIAYGNGYKAGAEDWGYKCVYFNVLDQNDTVVYGEDMKDVEGTGK